MIGTPQTKIAGKAAGPVLLVAGVGLIGLFLWKGLPMLLDKDDETDGDGTDGGGDIMQAVRRLDVEYGL